MSSPPQLAVVDLAASPPRSRHHASMSNKSVDASLGKGSLTGVDFDNQLEADYNSLHAAHSALLQRVQSDGYPDDANSDEAVRLRSDVKQLKQDLEEVTQERDELKIAVRDLRVRVEESRRAVMRLQGLGSAVPYGNGGRDVLSSASAVPNSPSLGGMQASTSGASLLSPTDTTFPASSSSATLDKRRSIGPGALPSWNPRETGMQPSVSGLGLSAEGSAATGAPTFLADEAEAKRAKRASVAFGPYAANLGTMGRRVGDRRVLNGEGSSSSMLAGQADSSTLGTTASSTGATQAATGGLRGLRLGAAANAPAPPPPSTVTNKRASFIGTSIFRSPPLNQLELNNDEHQPATTSLGSLLMPMRSIRRSSNSSSLSGGNNKDNDTFLGLPRSVSRSSSASASPSQASNTSPTIDRREIFGPAGDSNQEYPSGRVRQASVFDPQSQRGQNVSANVQRQLAESRERLADRETQLHALRREMLAVRMELDEAKKARAASDACLKALREFANGEVGSPTNSQNQAQGPVDMLRGMKLPPLPTDDLDEEDEDEQTDQLSVMSRQSSKQPDASESTWKALGRQFGSFSVKRSSFVPGSAAGPPGSVNYSGQSEGAPGLAPVSTLPMLGKPRSPSVSAIGLTGNGSYDGAVPLSPQFRSPRLHNSEVDNPSTRPRNFSAPLSPQRTSMLANASVGDMPRLRHPSGSSSSSTAGPNSASTSNKRYSLQQQQQLQRTAQDNNPRSPASRARKAMEATGSVDEDSGFVAPSFA